MDVLEIRVWKETVGDYFDVLVVSRNLLGGAEENC
jgi:hypothetical protein